MALTALDNGLFAMALGRRLRAARLRAGFPSCRSAAIAVGCSRMSITHWENGTHEPTASMVVRLSEIYRVSASELLGVEVSRA